MTPAPEAAQSPAATKQIPFHLWIPRALLAGFVVVSLWLAAAPAIANSKIVLATAGGSPDWLLGPLRFLGAEALAGEDAGWIYYAGLMLAMLLFAGLVWKATELSMRAIWITVIGLHVVFLLAPPLLSQDIFSYIAYARLGVVHDLNPYAFRPFDIPQDPVFGYAGSKDAVNVYGPFFALLSYPLAWLSVPTAFWLLKSVAAAASLGLIYTVRRIADVVDVEPRRAVVLLGLCPATLVHVVGGGHNEALVMLIVFVGVAVSLGVYSRFDEATRETAGGFTASLAIGIKASAMVPLPFMVAAAREKWRMFFGMTAGFALTLGTALVAFGSDAVGAINLISSNQDRSSKFSIPHKLVDGIELVFGDIDRAAATDIVRGLLLLALVAVVIWLLWRSFKQPETWIANAGWATLAVLLASAWLVPWYLLWLLPFAALGRNRALVVATVIFAGYTMAIAIPF